MKISYSMYFIFAFLFIFILSSNSAIAQVTFSGTELLGRPTNTSITINVIPDANIDLLYYEYGTSPGSYTAQTATTSATGDQAHEVVMSGLQSNTRYYYRMVYSTNDGSTWIYRDEHSFHTQRTPGSNFTFTIIADSHLGQYGGQTADEYALYERTLQNVAQDNPDLHLDLGDAFPMDPQPLGTGMTEEEARTAYLTQRPYLGQICHSIPFFLALGNHENEEGWNFDDTFTPPDQSLAIVGLKYRKMFYPNPIPDGFYSGNENPLPEAIGGDTYREDYFAWEWGDVLFVFIEPYHYTTIWPSEGDSYGGEGQDGETQGDRWDWTLGIEQYQWLITTLENSNAKFKFVFSHHVTGGNIPYGRGGIEAAPYFEWGGQNADDSWGFDTERPGWEMPIHQLMVAYGVDVFFHGHDHIYAMEELDGIVYLECPKPDDAGYDWEPYGYGYIENHYPNAIQIPNSGHIRVTVSPDEAEIEYIRSYLPGDGTNGEIAHSTTIPANPTGPTYDLTMEANPVSGGTTIPNAGVHTYAENSVITIAATPATGYTFDYWTGDVEDPNSARTTVTMNGNKTVTAHFATVLTYDLTMAVSPPGSGTTDPAVGLHTYTENTVVPITAIPLEGYAFDYWTGDVADPNSASTTVTMDGNKTIIAHFTEFIPGYITYIGDIGTTTSKTSGTTLVINTTAAVEAGDAIIIGLATDPYQSLGVSITDAAGNSYQEAAISICYGRVRTYIFAAYDVIALPGGSAISISFSNSITAKSAVASVFRGLAEVGSLDRSLGNPVAGAQETASGTTATVGPTGTTTQTAELLIGVIGTEGPVEDSPGTWDYSFIAGPRDGTSGGDAVSNITAAMGYRIVSTTAAYTAQKSGITSRYWGATIATFRAGPLRYDAIASDYDGGDGFSASLSHSDGDNFTATATGGTVSSIHAYRIDEDANSGVTVTPPDRFVDPLRYWGVRIFGTSPGYQVVYTYEGHPGIDDESSLRLATRTGPSDVTWVVETGTLPDQDNNTITLTGQTGTEYALASGVGDNSLPVNLTSFSAELVKGGVELKWVTESQLNNAGFEIWRAADNTAHFSIIASYASNANLAGDGNSSVRREYCFLDQKVESGKTYTYKLSDVDYNGKRTFHNVIEINVEIEYPKKYALYPNYPNPFNPSTTICFDLPKTCQVTLKIFNILGEEVAMLVSDRLSAGSYEYDWNASDLASGVYLYHLEAGEFVKIGKMLLMR
jgi:hypothetical protein